MKTLIALTVILVAAATLVTFVYFKSLQVPGRNTAKIIESIPADAGLVFRFSNDGSFDDVYSNSSLFASLISPEQLLELKALHNWVLQSKALKPLFTDQDIYISAHHGGELLFTFESNTALSIAELKHSTQVLSANLKVEFLKLGKLEGFTINLPQTARPFYVINRGDHLYSGSFSAALIKDLSRSKPTENHSFAPVSDQQQTHALANLYINYTQLQPLFDTWFKQKNTEVLKPLRLLPGTAALTLNYKRDALLFSGYTNLQSNLPAGYLTLFKSQQPYLNRLKDIFPALTAFSTCFAVSNPHQFLNDLTAWQNKAGLRDDRTALMNQIKTETGIALTKEFESQLGNEFGLITNRFDEKMAVIQLRNGSQLQPVLANISTMNADNSGKFNYPRLPFYLLGDAFTVFRQPYFRIVDNYLLLANTQTALINYLQNYNRQQFLSKQSRYNEFDDLLTERCNVEFFISFKNAAYLLKRDLQPSIYETVHPNLVDSTTFYAGALQLSGYHKQFFTNICMQLNKPDFIK